VACKCIRCREAGDKKFSIFNFQFSIIEYKASGGIEYFIQAVDKKDNTLYGFCRLRLGARDNKPPLVPPLQGGQKFPLPPLVKGGETGLIRELHVYGELAPVGREKKIQHAGLGKKLMAEAEKIARQNGYKKIAVISGVGVRGYYRKLGYRLNNSYMVKNLV
jgi:elongator complex protein 3